MFNPANRLTELHRQSNRDTIKLWIGFLAALLIVGNSDSKSNIFNKKTEQLLLVELSYDLAVWCWRQQPQMKTRLRGRTVEESEGKRRNKRSMASRPEQTWVHLQSFQAVLLMAPSNEKPNTLHSAIIASAFRDGKFLSVTHGPTKDDVSLKNGGAASTPSTPAASRPRRALVIAFY